MKAAADGFAAGVRAKRPPMLPQMGNMQNRPRAQAAMAGKVPPAGNFATPQTKFAPTKNNMNDGMPTNSRSRPALMSNGGKAKKKGC
jgi:hypothetical protein